MVQYTDGLVHESKVVEMLDLMYFLVGGESLDKGPKEGVSPDVATLFLEVRLSHFGLVTKQCFLAHKVPSRVTTPDGPALPTVSSFRS